MTKSELKQLIRETIVEEASYDTMYEEGSTLIIANGKKVGEFSINGSVLMVYNSLLNHEFEYNLEAPTPAIALKMFKTQLQNYVNHFEAENKKNQKKIDVILPFLSAKLNTKSQA